MNKNKLALAAAAAGATLCGVIASSADAAVIDPGLYVLLNHPSTVPVPYGLRLDELYNVNPSQQDVFIFDFEHSDSLMILELTPTSIHITGEVYGGLWRSVGGYVPGPFTGVHSVDFLFSTGVGLAPGDDDWVVNAPNNVNSGSILTPQGDTISLWDERGGNPFSFRLGDEDNDAGYRGFDGPSGWGWLNHGSNPAHHITSGDWIFAVGPQIPTPGAAMTMLVALGVLAPRRRRR